MNLASPITARVSVPTPEEIRSARASAGLTQEQAAHLVSPATGKAYRTWQNYEAASSSPEHRAIPLALWELFLLLTGQHLHLKLTSHKDAV